jgi:S1-C subfamily serine protease
LLLAVVVLFSPRTRAEEGLSAKQLAELKAATVYLKLLGVGRAATGSGFLVHVHGNDGYVVTNEHVVSTPVRRARREGEQAAPPPQITGVLYSGTPQQRAVTAVEILARDPQHDLAVLKLPGVKDLPRPLNLRRTGELRETLQVFSFGFPFGQALAVGQANPALTVTKGSVSSLRQNEQGEVVAVQLDSNLNPGNSGGPVVDGQGRLIGVVRAGIPGSGISLAIPTAAVVRLLAGRATEVRLTGPHVKDKWLEVTVHVTLADPLRRLRGVRIHYRPTPEGGENGLRPGIELTPSTPLELKLEHPQAQGTLRLPTEGKATARLTVQASVLNDDGAWTYGLPVPYTLEVSQPTPHTVEVSRATARLSLPRLNPPADLKAPVLPESPFVRPLPAAWSSVAVGGGGRYLILHLPHVRQLAVFDITEARLVHFLPASADTVHFAAGRDKLLVGLPATKQIERWDLHTFQREAVGSLEGAGGMNQFVLGSNSRGPLLVDGTFLDISTLQPLPRPTSSKPIIPMSMWARASANGRVYGVWAGEQSNPMAYLLGDDRLLQNLLLEFRNTVRPAPDGSAFYVGTRLLSPHLKPLGPPGLPGRCCYLPAVQGNYFLAVDPDANVFGNAPFVGIAGSDRPVVRLAGVDLGDAARAVDTDFPPLDQRVYFLPDAKLIVTLPPGNDRVVLHHVDVEQALAKADVDYLFVTSASPAAAKRGTTWKHVFTWRSRKGGVTPRLVVAPLGVALSPKGQATWEVPGDFAEEEVLLTLALRDASGQETWHTVAVSIER